MSSRVLFKPFQKKKKKKSNYVSSRNIVSNILISSSYNCNYFYFFVFNIHSGKITSSFFFFKHQIVHIVGLFQIVHIVGLFWFTPDISVSSGSYSLYYFTSTN